MANLRGQPWHVLLRRKEVRFSRLAIGSALVALTACSAGSAPRPSTRPPPAPIVGPGQVPAHGLRTIQSIGGGRLVGLWASANRPRRTLLAVSDDGGTHWGTTGVSLPLRSVRYPAPEIAFASRRRGVVLVSEMAFSTADGGRTWRRVPAPGFGMNLSIEHGVVWVVSEPCQAMSCTLALTSGSLMTAEADGSFSWATHRMAWFVRQGVQPLVTRLGPAAGMVASGGDDPTARVYATRDGGRRWQAGGAPCTIKTTVNLKNGRRVKEMWVSFAALASAVDGRTRYSWALCGGGAAAGTATKGLEISSNEGRSWSQVAAFSSIAPYRNPAALPGGDAGALFALSGGDLLQTDQNSLATSTNLGATWHGVLGAALEGSGDDATLTANRTGTVWVLAPRVGLWQGSVGGTWHKIAR